MKRKIVALLLCFSTVIGLVGCGASSEQLNELQSMESANTEAAVTENYKLSYSDEQNLIYTQVSDRQLLDLTTLSACTDNELQEVINYMDAVDAQLCGTSSTAIDATIDTCFTDYLLAEFEKTPYYWQRSQTIVRGIDAESRSIIVDVVYKTIDFAKDVKTESYIPLGENGYQMAIKNRFDRYIAILNDKINNPGDTKWQVELDEFEKHYGKVEDILDSQTDLKLTEQIYETGNQKTYVNLIDSDAEQSHASMTVRYVLVPNYVLGINLGLTCKHMYITNYALDNDITTTMELFTDEGYDTVTDSVYSLLYSYFQCIDENDYKGLCKLTKDFGKLDKYYEEMFNTTYMKHENFTVSLFDIQGTHIKCGVNVATKRRAKGSEMTFPSYTDRYYVELELVNDILNVSNMVLLSSSLEGEPAIKTDDAETLGFASKIDLDNADKQAIEQLICNFGVLQLQRDTTSDEFGKVVDLSMSQSNMNNLVSSMTNLNGARKAVWLSNYQQGTSNYASVKCTELFQQDDNSIIETSAIYDFILKGDTWYVYNYTVLSSVRLSTTNLNTSGCLCLVTPTKVETYTSQIKGTTSVSDEIVTDISRVYDHEPYTPNLKSGTSELGLDTESSYSLNSEDFETTLNTLIVAAELDMDATQFMSDLDDFIVDYQVCLNSDNDNDTTETEDYVDTRLQAITVDTYLDESLNNVVAIYYNLLNNRYLLDSDKNNAIETARSEWNSKKIEITEACKETNNNDLNNKWNTINNEMDKFYGMLH